MKKVTNEKLIISTVAYNNSDYLFLLIELTIA